ncbi:agamous-like MADS-box protein AGL61 [Lycium ferocissimum]|uniref:agamous-like MADS-box protein AGL61 n=1 Tax=Lycium ferocissimum TaxID=112874 RepID=UPI0028159157|nr:agamous-like MADS-box protein AGL61 [Lycium ferocissimum]
MERKSSEIRKGIPIRKEVEIEFIKDKRAEHAIISNMQKSLYKKVKDLSILCGVEIAIIIFSIAGQPFFFGNPDVESVVHQFAEAKQPTASPSSRYIMKKRMKKRKEEEHENKEKAIDPSEDFKLTNLERVKKLDQKIEKFEDRMVKEIVQQQFVIGSEDSKFVHEMSETSSSTFPFKWLSL